MDDMIEWNEMLTYTKHSHILSDVSSTHKTVC